MLFFFFFTELGKAAHPVRAGNDSDFIDRSMLRCECRNKGVSCFVNGNKPHFLFVVFPALLFETDAYFINCLVEVSHRNFVMAVSDSKKGSFVYHIRQIGSRKANRAMGERLKINSIIKFYIFSVNSENRFTALYIRSFDRNLTVKAARSEQSRVKNVGTVRRRKNDKSLFVVKAVHLDQKLVQSLLTLVIA